MEDYMADGDDVVVLGRDDAAGAQTWRVIGQITRICLRA